MPMADRGRRWAAGRGRGEHNANGASSRNTLLAAVALQDHIARTMRIPGGPKSLPSTEPGAEMTLAQHLGLVPKPPPLLSLEEWDEVHLKARLRQHSSTECPICREEFKSETQVLLSCTHVFHKSCLASFERFAQVRCCPLCRAVQYQRRLINDGAEAYRHRCATKIQAWWRGHQARKQCCSLRKHHPPTDPRLRRKWAAERLEEQSSALIRDMEAERGDIDALFAELDASLALSRAVHDELVGPRVTQRLQERLQVEEAIARSLHDQGTSTGSIEDTLIMPVLAAPQSIGPAAQQQAGTSQGAGAGRGRATGAGSSNSSGVRPRTLPGTQAQTTPARPGAGSSTVSEQRAGRQGHGTVQSRTAGGAGSRGGGTRTAATIGRGILAAHPQQRQQAAEAEDVDWDAVVAKARARCEEDCPVCLGAIGRNGDAGIAYLSCTHCFHLECITAMEAYTLASGKQFSCPVCRGPYQRRCFA